jgi:hypothetical protein
MSKTFAVCYASGHIKFEGSVPRGTLVVATCDDSKKLEEFISGVSRHGYKLGELFVPGVPEADDDMIRLEALKTFCERIKEPAKKLGIKVLP